MYLENRKTRIGLLLFGADRFRKIGEGTSKGSYAKRQLGEAKKIQEELEKQGTVIYPGICYTESDIQQDIKLFFQESVDYIFVTHLSWTEDRNWIRFLRDMPEVPVLFASITRDRIPFENTFSDDNFCQLLVCNGLVGTMEASGSAVRYKRNMLETVSGTMEQVMTKAKAFGGAARARGILRESKIGLLGPYNEVMWSTYVDPYRVFMDIGPELHFYSVGQLVQQVQMVSEEAVETAVKELEASYPKYGEVDPEYFRASVRASIGFQQFYQKTGVDVMILNDIDQELLEELGLRPGFVWVGDSKDAVIVPEGDIGSGIAVYLLRILSGKQVNYIEPFYIKHDKQEIAVAHGGPNDYRDPNGTCLIGADERYKNSGLKYGGAPIAWYVFPPGDVTLLHMSQSAEGFKLVASSAESLPSEHYMSSYSHGLIRPKNSSCEEWVGALMKIGVTQHSGMVPGDYQEEIQLFAKIMGFEHHQL